MKPTIPTIKISIPKMIIGHCRILTHDSACKVVSQIPAAMIGIERSTAMKFMTPITLLLNAILQI
jgi:hypothetical protein